VLALEEEPHLDVDAYLAQVGTWSDAVRARLEGTRDIERIVDAINKLLFDEEDDLHHTARVHDPAIEQRIVEPKRGGIGREQVVLQDEIADLVPHQIGHHTRSLHAGSRR